jgi:hypothetical protein
VGGFEYDSDREDIEDALRGFTKDATGIVDVFSPGKLASVGIIEFSSPGHMWTFLKTHKGKKFTHKGKTLWHNIEKTLDERTRDRHISAGVRLVREAVVAAGMADAESVKKMIDAEYPKTRIYYKVAGARAVDLLVKSAPGSVLLMVSPDAIEIPGVDWDDVVAEANRDTER